MAGVLWSGNLSALGALSSRAGAAANSLLPAWRAAPIASGMPGIGDDISTALKGAAMGAANVIPGVSGGTIAFITGIYERLINAIKSCGPHAAKLALGRRFKEFAAHVDLRFLAAVAIGAVLSILVLAKALEAAFEHHPILIWAFFLGLIVASIWGVGKMVKRWTPGAVVALLLGLAAAVGILFLPHSEGNENGFYLFLCGVAAISSMIIPGVSGSFVLLLMGNYLLVLGAISAVVSGVVGFSFDASFAAALGLLVPFGVGCVFGLVALSHILSWIFARYHDVAVALITGFIIGSLVLIWPWKDTVYKTDAAGAYLVKTEDREVVARAGDLAEVRAGLAGEEELIAAGFANWRLPPFGEADTWLAILLALLGAGLVLGIEWVGRRGGRGEVGDEGAG